MVTHFLTFISGIYYYILNFILFSFLLDIISKKILVGHDWEGAHRVPPWIHLSVCIYWRWNLLKKCVLLFWIPYISIIFFSIINLFSRIRHINSSVYLFIHFIIHFICSNRQLCYFSSGKSCRITFRIQVPLSYEKFQLI